MPEDTPDVADTATPEAHTAQPESPQGDMPDKDYPLDKPLSQMTTEEQLAYWKWHTRKWEKQATASLAEAKTAARERDAIKKATQTEAEKALDVARSEGRTAALRDVGSKLVYAEIRAAAAGRLTADQQTALLDGLDHMRFLDDAGEVDTGKVSKFVAALAPAAPNGQPQPVMGRPDFGQGRRETTPPVPGSAGLAEAQRRFGIKTT